MGGELIPPASVLDRDETGGEHAWGEVAVELPQNLDRGAGTDLALRQREVERGFLRVAKAAVPVREQQPGRRAVGVAGVPLSMGPGSGATGVRGHGDGNGPRYPSMRERQADPGRKIWNKAIPQALWSVSRLEASSGGKLMAIFSHLIPAKYRNDKRDMTSRNFDDHGFDDHGFDDHGRDHGRHRRHSHHGHHW
ncbi:hypothetical protein ACFU6I_04565 [Streptomyces sp. NPDC057486]|uniref:hypothetical protein n=1 Tax=Streptomyces sp. NPDC057486 TaxID=3346145 RepID=UPI0036C9C826